MKELVMSWVCARCFCGLKPKIMKMKNEMKKSNEKAFSLDTCIMSYNSIIHANHNDNLLRQLVHFVFFPRHLIYLSIVNRVSNYINHFNW